MMTLELCLSFCHIKQTILPRFTSHITLCPFIQHIYNITCNLMMTLELYLTFCPIKQTTLPWFTKSNIAMSIHSTFLQHNMSSTDDSRVVPNFLSHKPDHTAMFILPTFWQHNMSSND